MDLDFQDRVVVVTGGGGGISLAAIHEFLAGGARVVTADIDVSTVKSLDGVTAIELDLMGETAPRELVECAVAEHGKVDVLVNGVGAGIMSTDFLETSEESWRWHIEMNLMIAVRATRAALPSMIAQGSGAVVSVSSFAGRQPRVYFPEYSTSKAALIAWSHCLSKMYGQHGIRFNTVAPGTTRTPPVEHALEEHFPKTWGVSPEEAQRRFFSEKQLAIERLCEPEEVAAAIVFLASDAASMITGVQLSVDGGAMHVP